MTAPAVNSVLDPFTADARSLNAANSSKFTVNTGFTFGNRTPRSADADITKPVTPVSDHSPDFNDRKDSSGSSGSNGSNSGSYSHGPSVGKAGVPDMSDKVKGPSEDAAAKTFAHSPAKPTPSANLNPTGIFSTIPGLGLGANTASPSKSSLPAKPLDTVNTANTANTATTLGPAVGEKRKADDAMTSTLNKPATGSSARRSLQTTVEDVDSGAESKADMEPDAKKTKMGPEPAASISASASAPVVNADTSGKSAETETPAGAAEKKRGRPKKGQAKKKAPAPVGQTARKTRSQGPAA